MAAGAAPRSGDGACTQGQGRVRGSNTLLCLTLGVPTSKATCSRAAVQVPGRVACGRDREPREAMPLHQQGGPPKQTPASNKEPGSGGTHL